MILIGVVVGWLLLVFLNVPIGLAMIFVSMAYSYWSGLGLSFSTQRMVDGLNSFPMLAIPLFILTAEILNSAGITKHLFGFARALVGHITGGLGHVNIMTSVFFAGISGSASADIAAVLMRLALSDPRTMISRIKALAPLIQNSGWRAWRNSTQPQPSSVHHRRSA